MNKSSTGRSVLAAAALCLALAGCQGNEPGTATTGTPTDEPTSQQPTSSGNSSGKSLADIEPCSVLKASDVSTLGISEWLAKDDNSCSGKQTGGGRVQVNLFADLGLAQYKIIGAEAEPEDTTVGGKKAKFVKKAATNTACTVAVEVTESSRYDVDATGSDLQKNCDIAMKVATAVVPNLP